MGYIILGLMVLLVFGFIWMFKWIKKVESKRHQRFMDFAQERGLKYSFDKLVSRGGFNRVEGQLDGSEFLLEELTAGKGHKTRYHETVSILENKEIDFSFTIGTKYVSGIPNDMEELNAYDLALSDSKLIAKTNDPQKFSQLIMGISLEDLQSLENDFESAIIGHNGKLSYTVGILLPNEKKFQSYVKIVDEMRAISNAIQNPNRAWGEHD